MDKRKIIIDTDCGSDDAMAIAMALNDPSVEILFFTTVHGNVSAEQAAINTLITIEHSGSYEPSVYLGCQKPLLRESVFAYETHGKDGMGDIGLKVKKLSIAEGNGVLKILDALRDSEAGEIEIITLGTLTNIAVAMMLDPDAMRKVKRISMMGSAGLGYGNVSPVAEFNIWQDAESAKIVLDFGVPLLFVGWDACLGEAMLHKDDIEKIRTGSDLGRFSIDCNRQLMELNTKRFGEPVLDMADPAAMAAILYPECIRECDDYYCDVDISKGISYGAVLVDRCHDMPNKPNAAVCSALIGERFKEYLYRTLCESQR
ncbi:nucleoside hydrolase [Hydrogenoanaerobacterium sp.]|uniref:nucleoside hydrolase n=1 Tax=Hydrogenoanaerobacterium sp. TaxID=2953763 RepID=UPI0028A2CC8B|nr:nucleoside hydrolase [Hydrogenoanaerobacterium sp.]